MDVFNLRAGLIEDYQNYVESFIHVADERIRGKVEGELDGGLLWPEPLVQLNPSFESGGFVDDLVAEGLLHPECSNIFRVGKESAPAAAALGATATATAPAAAPGAPAPAPAAAGKPLRLHRHQTDAVRAAATGANYVLTTGTGSGKSLAYIIPIVDHVLRGGGCRPSSSTP